MDLNRLPYGNPEFSSIREQNMIYVDKTKLIATLADQRAPIFFSRPRRFGKSLLINTLHSLFSDGLDIFHNLEIEKIWKDKTYKVVHFDFSSMAEKNIHDFTFSLSAKIINEFGECDELIASNSPKLQYPDIILDEIAKKLSNNSVVFLVDEYDAPLTHHINEPDELKKIISVLSNFYATIKQYTGKFRFIFITGITRICHISIFSTFNNLLDLSFDEDFNSLLGFTQDDLRKYFDPFIENSAQILKMSKEDVYKRIEQFYDGFQFSIEAEETIYNPWSILSFLKLSKNGFRNYWFMSSGSASLIMQYLKTSDHFKANKKHDIFITEDKLLDRYEIDTIPRDILLFQTGYLTIRKKADNIAKLVFPNTEVEDSILKLYLMSNNLEPDIKFSDEIQSLSKYIDEKNLKKIVMVFNDILNDCVSILSNIFTDERSIRDIIYAALPQKNTLQKIKERESAKGFSDLELLTQKTHMVIEFKRTSKDRTPHLCLKEALEQIQNKNYGSGAFQNHTLYRVAMVISSEEKMILSDFCREVL